MGNEQYKYSVLSFYNWEGVKGIYDTRIPLKG